MKKALLIISAITLIACGSSKEKTNTNEAINTVSASNSGLEKMNDTVPYEDSVMLLGKSNRKGLQMPAFKDWYDLGYSHYRTAPETGEQLKPLLEDVSILVFMGTWCSDSQRDVPHLYRILDDMDFDESELSLINVSDHKTTPQGFEKDYDIINVPTIIFIKNDKELGRIVEYPIETLEDDMLAILSGKDYKHAYAE
ncbi:thioredoxin family protein [Aequorivita marina]|uniref:thioredoxin family protein n=1 Tax=Aequorivita marina TaxID=3073654 RepID=UPI0028757913|nr:thioredoxin family protein [Aequorivita sp. S2608]MDS1298276.1 thioredoxin family protein [Aequorivita sp. S2608]